MVKSGKNKLIFFSVLLGIALILPSLYYLANHKYQIKADSDLKKVINTFSLNNDGKFLVINKNTRKLIVYSNYKANDAYTITLGKKPGNKIFSGDNRTPEGIFLIKSIENSSKWVYDFKNDTLEPIVGAYGPWFIRLNVPGFDGIGIHGFYHDQELGERASHGCIRLNNTDLERVVSFVEQGMPVVILPGEKDREINAKYLESGTH